MDNFFEGYKIEWKGNGLYALTVPSADKMTNQHWFKLEKLNHVETAKQLGMRIEFIVKSEIT